MLLFVFDVGYVSKASAEIMKMMYMLSLCVIVVHQKTFNVVFGYDILTPYIHQHGSRHHHRVIRECQKSGNQPYEMHPALITNNITKPFVKVKRFVKVLSSDVTENVVHGHYAIVMDPLRTISILEPHQVGGCKLNLRDTVLETSKQKNCEVAINAGYFNTKNGSCLGNVISDGVLVQSSGGIQNVHFGLMKNKSLFTGYLSEAQVKDENFVQLVGGVVWVLRNGSDYINVSKYLECEDTEETGAMDKFINVLSARTVIGHDREGRVVIVQVDGKTHHFGISLWDMQKLIMKMGLINAVNLDGGGSASFVVNGTVVNYPSDSCLDEEFVCERKVSTVICIHPPECDPPDCHDHGKCDEGLCVCEKNWLPPNCNQLKCSSNCSGHGLCTEQGCHCESGFYGEHCDKACPDGWFGPSCLERCDCLNGAICHPQNGTCICSSGFIGDKCQHTCPYGFYGRNCENSCKCKDSCFCSSVNGSCDIEKNSSMYIMEKCFSDSLILKGPLVKDDNVDERKCLYYIITLSVITAISIAFVFVLIFYSCSCYCKKKQKFCTKRKQYRYKDLQALTVFSEFSESDSEPQNDTVSVSGLVNNR